MTGDVALRGRTAGLARRVLCAVERPSSVGAVAREVDAPAEKVARLLARLESQGLVTTLAELDKGPGADREANAALRLFADEGLSDAVTADGARAEIVCLGDEELGARFAELTSASLGVRLSRRPVLDEADAPALSGEAPSFVVSLARDRDEEHLRRLDRWSRRAGVPYLAGWFEGVTVVLTHVVVPRRTACYDCLCVRERAAAPGPGESGGTEASAGGPPLAFAPAGRLAAGDGLLTSLASLRAVNVFAGHANEAPAPVLLQLSFTTLKLTRHPVLRVPMCESCGHAQ
ncbi:TOMM precursor leader peptide-binding protein [Streptomyces armeniacus]|uniref:TOMM precursor leader peptide-binding protein n=1 Tax=Streptomyces armeniacus TaxID=83291 RepID=UPI001C9AAF37|nr:TOMM precursor leader peptide-binding protein [Streptomyces armeniacus]